MIALLRATSGLIVWAIAFALLYGLQGLACAGGWDAISAGPLPLGQAVLVLVWLAFLVLLGWMVWHLGRHPAEGAFMHRLGLGIAITGLAATIFTGFPVVATSMCV